MTIGQRIKLKRELKGITLDELSKYAKVTRQTLSRYETGVINNIPSDKIEIIASVLSTTPAYLMGWEDTSRDDREAEALNIISQLSEDKQKLVLEYLRFLLSQREK